MTRTQLRRTYSRRHPDILNRLIVHAAAFNLGLLLRLAIGCATQQGLQGRRRPCFVAVGGRGGEAFPNPPRPAGDGSMTGLSKRR